jgi:hypothetical protein
VVALLSPGAAVAAGVIKIDDDKAIFVATGLRVSAGAGGLVSTAPTNFDLALDGAIVSFGGQFGKTLKITLNGGRAPTGVFTILDAFGAWEPTDWFKIWVGRFLMPTDRASLTGPFFALPWDAPMVSAFPSSVAGRGDGIAIWGYIPPLRLKYMGGVFRRPDVMPQRETDLMGAIRLQWSVFGEEPNYYANGSWFGRKNVLTLGAGLRLAPQTIGPKDAPTGDLWGWTVDAFFEHNLGSIGVLTLEAALFRYYVTAVEPGTPYGTATYEQVGFLPNVLVGSGKLQFVFRHQHLQSKRGDRLDGSVHYLLQGHLVRFALTAFGDLPTTPAPAWGVRLGAQLIL